MTTKKNIIYQYVHFAISTGYPLYVAIVISSKLGSEQLGIYFLITGMASLLIVILEPAGKVGSTDTLLSGVSLRSIWRSRMIYAGFLAIPLGLTLPVIYPAALNTEFVLAVIVYSIAEVASPTWYLTAQKNGESVMKYSLVTRLVALLALAGFFLPIPISVDEYLISVGASWLVIAVFWYKSNDQRLGGNRVSVLGFMKRIRHVYIFNIVSGARTKSFDVVIEITAGLEMLAIVGLVYRLFSVVGDALLIFLSAITPGFYSADTSGAFRRTRNRLLAASVIIVAISNAGYGFIPQQFSITGITSVEFFLLSIQFVPMVLSVLYGNLRLLPQRKHDTFLISSLAGGAALLIFMILFEIFQILTVANYLALLLGSGIIVALWRASASNSTGTNLR